MFELCSTTNIGITANLHPIIHQINKIYSRSIMEYSKIVAEYSIDHVMEVNRTYNSQESINSICYLAPDFFYIFI